MLCSLMANKTDMKQLPALYSFRRCPYAIRARLALLLANQTVELREVVLKNKPAELLACSPKGTVPVLVTDNQIIDESLDIMHWALDTNFPSAAIDNCDETAKALVTSNDKCFKHWLDKYKYFDRHPENSRQFYRDQACEFIAELESRLENQLYIGQLDNHDKPGFADLAIWPFIRQFAFCDMEWFRASTFSKTVAWLDRLLHNPVFKVAMTKYPPWQAGQETVLFADQAVESDW